MIPVQNTHRIQRSARFKALSLACGGAAILTTTVLLRDPSANASPAARGYVDTYTPTFSHPTRITNPLFPVNGARQMVQLGTEGDTTLRNEVTTLPYTKKIIWNGVPVETVVSQFVAFIDGRVAETAVDYFAQDDRGAVWYFGEDVTNYEDGVVANHNGTWLAGRDGPPGMIMPKDPKVGDVYRPENIPGLVFEETTVEATGLTVDGPSGRIRNAISVLELPAGSDPETKIFAPGYGEFKANVPAADELVFAAIAVPIDARRGNESRALDRLSDAAQDLARMSNSPEWSAVRSKVSTVVRSWRDVRIEHFPPLLREHMDAAVDTLVSEANAGNIDAVQTAAIDILQTEVDLGLLTDPVSEVDRDRVDIWRMQLEIDLADGNHGGVEGDRVVLRALAART